MASERNFSVKPYINLREKLAQNFSAHPQVGLYLRHHTAVIDKFVKDCAAFAKVPPTCAIAALGGYGRREMFPYSDIDVAVLTPEGLSQADQTAIAEFVTLLWSLGLTVGTNVRTKAETLKITASDITAATAFLEARWIYGNKALFKDTHDTFLQELASRMFFRSKMLEMRQRHQKYGDTPYALEPNIKEGLGGLRDLQVFLWYAKAAGYGTSWKEMAQAGLITGTEAYHFTQCTHFLRELRIRLHLICGRHEDRLIFDVQTALAKNAGYKPKGSLLPSEALMKRFYLNAKNIVQLTQILVAAITEKLLGVIRKSQDYLVRLDWDDNVIFPQQAVQNNLYALKEALEYLEKGEIAPALESFNSIDNNCYAFQFEREVFYHFTEYIMKQSPDRLMWGKGRIIHHENLYVLVESL